MNINNLSFDEKESNINNLSFDEKESNINNLLIKSTYQILTFKKDFNKLYNLIFTFCSTYNIIISNYNINISKIQNKQYDLTDLDNDFKFNLFTTDPYRIGILLSNLLYTKYSKYIVMSTYLKNKEIIISIDNDRIIRIQLFFMYTEIGNEPNIIKELEINTFQLQYNLNTYNLQYSSDLFELMQLSYQLYHPSYFLKFYKKNNLKSLVFSELITSILQNNTYINNQSIKYLFLEKIRKHLINILYNDTYLKLQVILLDTYAIDALNNDTLNINLFNYNYPLHILISSKYIDFIIKILNKYIDFNQNTNYKLIIKTNTIYISNDFRFNRTNIVLYDTVTNKKQILLFIYNSLDYEVLPTIMSKNTLYIPHQLVIIRFLIINYYYIYLYDSKYNKSYLDIFLYNLSQIISKNDLYMIKKYNIINYIGIYKDDKIDKYKISSSIYRPHQYKFQNKHLLD